MSQQGKTEQCLEISATRVTHEDHYKHKELPKQKSRVIYGLRLNVNLYKI